MSVMWECHKKLNEMGEGKCSLPMWMGGMPAGFCDKPAYGFETKEHEELMRCRNESQFIPGLACPAHGGPKKEQAVHLCANCAKHIATCDGNPKFGTGKGNDNIYECDCFTAIDPRCPLPDAEDTNLKNE